LDKVSKLKTKGEIEMIEQILDKFNELGEGMDP
jgi:hypothetical protein